MVANSKNKIDDKYVQIYGLYDSIPRAQHITQWKLSNDKKLIKKAKSTKIAKDKLITQLDGYGKAYAIHECILDDYLNSLSNEIKEHVEKSLKAKNDALKGSQKPIVTIIKVAEPKKRVYKKRVKVKKDVPKDGQNEEEPNKEVVEDVSDASEEEQKEEIINKDIIEDESDASDDEQKEYIDSDTSIETLNGESQELLNIKITKENIAEKLDPYFDKWLKLKDFNPKGFHANFDIIWRAAGYSFKADAKKVLKSQYEEGFDFSGNRLKSTGGRTAERIMLTVDSAKEFLIGASTANGRLFKHYFIEVEDRYRKLKKELYSGRLELKDNKTGEIYNPNRMNKSTFQIEESARIQTRIKCMEPNRIDYNDGNSVYLELIGARKNFKTKNIHDDEVQDDESDTFIKFGYSIQISQRESEHKSDYGESIPIKIWHCNNKEKAEREFKVRMAELGLIKHLKMENKIKKEVIITNKEYNIDRIIYIMDEIVARHNDFNNSKLEMIELKHQLELERKDKEHMQKLMNIIVCLAKNNIQIPNELQI